MIQERLSLTRTQMRSLAQRGVLQATKYNENNWALYPESVIEVIRTHMSEVLSESPSSGETLPRLSTSYASEQGALVFELLEEGASLSAIVIKLRVHPATVQLIAKDYEACTRTVILNESIMDQMNAILPDVELTTGAEICAALRFAVKQIACAKCRAADRAETCLPCLCVTLERKRAASADSSEAEPAAVGLPQDPEHAPETNEAAVELPRKRRATMPRSAAR